MIISLNGRQLISVLYFILIFQFNVPAQTLIGLKAGIVDSDLITVFNPGITGADDYKDNKFGISASLFFQKYVSKKFSIELNFRSSNMGTKFFSIVRYNLFYLSTPVILGFDLIQKKNISIYLNSGFSPALFSGGSVGYGQSMSRIEPVQQIRRFDIFWEAGTGVVFFPTENFAIKTDINIIRGLTNVSGNQPELFSYIRNKANSYTVGIAQKF
jgi:hypothetical protein